ncbi:hypothetical protein dsat_2088 [Alkalidesulfovibrio alkalitolerans DSM 16529]|uniref:Uncharacterized protein n=1 Tax=Alkalidesulfovibrio alkalitolerans DSM 16529 TaxID=1121439 RepID=S7TDV7_9BACT|nr:hypothetical protein [Alkalidesulfovibrio alkalitolerans]EPR35387.1 hypothetical protein dsat_2088 [Alkalidesulfovibrio alkalitolerans DSM 16529]
MAKSSNNVSNAEIIELTDLLEPGDPSKVRDGDADLDDLLGGGDDDASLDDLLNAGDGDLKGMGDIDLPDDSDSGGAGDEIDMDGLDDLLADMNGGKATSDDDIEAMLGGAPGGSLKPPSQDDIDDLLAGLDDEAPGETPDETDVEPKKTKAASQDDIDDLLAGLDDAQPADLPDDEPEPAVAPASAPKADDTDYDIEALLAATDEAGEEKAPVPRVEDAALVADSETPGPDEPVALDFDETEEDLDKLLKDIDTDISLDEATPAPLASVDAQRIEALEARLASLDGIEGRLAALEAGRTGLATDADAAAETNGIEEAVERVLARRLDDVSASLREAIKTDLVAVIEKAVPAAAARIIREEIAALAETLDEDD